MRLSQSFARPVNRDLNNPYPPFVSTLLRLVTPSRWGHEVLGQGIICSSHLQSWETISTTAPFCRRKPRLARLDKLHRLTEVVKVTTGDRRDAAFNYCAIHTASQET